MRRRGSPQAQSNHLAGPMILVGLCAAGVATAYIVKKKPQWVTAVTGTVHALYRKWFPITDDTVESGDVVSKCISNALGRIVRSEHRDPFTTIQLARQQREQANNGLCFISAAKPPVEFPLPLVLVDIEAFKENVRSMASLCLAQEKKVRLHTKSFRVPELVEIAARTIEELADRITVASITDTQKQHHQPLPPINKDVISFEGVDELDGLPGVAPAFAVVPTRPPLAKERILYNAVSGLMTFTAEETLFWARRGSFRSLLLGYPIADAHSAHLFIDAMLINPKVVCTCVVDSIAQVRAVVGAAIEAVRHERYLTKEGFDPSYPVLHIRVMLDVDMSYRPLGNICPSLHFGCRRSPLRCPNDVSRLVEEIQVINQLLTKEMENEKVNVKVDVEGMMGYEAQIAGYPDLEFSNRKQSAIPLVAKLCKNMHETAVSLMKKLSMRDVRYRRKLCAEALAAAFPLHPLVINGGGTGSVCLSLTDTSLTEITIGSGALCGHLFDRFLEHKVGGKMPLRPAIFIALGVNRIAFDTTDIARDGWFSKRRKIVACSGGGWIASGALGEDRLPRVVLPTGVAPLLTNEGFGEVQTPFECTGDSLLIQHGDVILVRPPKSGEIAEHFEEYFLVSGGEHDVMKRVQTYRGMSLSVWS